MRTAYVNFPYYSSARNSMGVFCNYICDVLTDVGFDVIFCSISSSDMTAKHLTLPLRLRSGIGRVDSILLNLAMLMSVFKRRRRDFVIVNVSQEFIFPFFLDRSINIIHDTIQSDEPRSRSMTLIMRLCWSLCARSRLNVSVSHTTKIDALRYGIESEVVYLNPFDTPTHQNDLKHSKPYHAMWCGTLAPHKRFTHFIALAHANPTMNFIAIVPREDRLSAIALSPSNLNIVSDIDESLYQELIQSSCFVVSTSTREGFGRPPMEAALLGTPVIVTDIPIYRELYDGVAIFTDGTIEDLKLKFSIAPTVPPASDDAIGNLKRKINQKESFANLIGERFA